MAEAETRSQYVDQQLMELRQELRRVRRTSREASDLRAYQWDIARVLLALTHGEATAAMQYIRSKSATRPDASALEARAQHRLLAWWGAALDDDKLKLVQEDSESQPHRKALVAAHKFLVAYNLVHWVERQNLDKGLAPMTPLVLTQARVCAREQGLGFPVKECSLKKWMHRWRLRHSLRLRVMPTKEPLTTATMHAKVCPYSETWAVKQTESLRAHICNMRSL